MCGDHAIGRSTCWTWSTSRCATTRKPVKLGQARASKAAQVGVSKASYLPSPSLTAAGSRSRVDVAPSVYQRSVGLSLSYLLYDFGARAAIWKMRANCSMRLPPHRTARYKQYFFRRIQAYYQTPGDSCRAECGARIGTRSKRKLCRCEARYLAGSATPADKLQAQTALLASHAKPH